MFLKPQHLLQGAVTKPADLCRNWLHRLRKYALKLGLCSSDKYLSKLNFGGNSATWAVAEDGHQIVCMYCKHAIARIKLSDGWTVETCSAQGLNDVLNTKHAEQWAQNLQTMYILQATQSNHSQRIEITSDTEDLPITQQSPYTSDV